jgi:hypothetical protein
MWKSAEFCKHTKSKSRFRTQQYNDKTIATLRDAATYPGQPTYRVSIVHVDGWMAVRRAQPAKADAMMETEYHRGSVAMLASESIPKSHPHCLDA